MRRSVTFRFRFVRQRSMQYATNLKNFASLKKLGIAAWLMVVIAGMLALIDYSQAPGAQAETTSEWPVGSTIQPDPDQPTLIMFVHPRCACSRSSLNQLARILADGRFAANVQFVFYCPNGEPETWAYTGLWNLAGKLTNTRHVIDLDGAEAKRFGATTSGHAFVFSSTGQRVFSGGITNGRSHEGDSIPAETVRQILRGETVQRTDWPAYGCPIASDSGVAQ